MNGQSPVAPGEGFSGLSTAAFDVSHEEHGQFMIGSGRKCSLGGLILLDIRLGLGRVVLGVLARDVPDDELVFSEDRGLSRDEAALDRLAAERGLPSN